MNNKENKLVLFIGDKRIGVVPHMQTPNNLGKESEGFNELMNKISIDAAIWLLAKYMKHVQQTSGITHVRSVNSPPSDVPFTDHEVEGLKGIESIINKL